MEFKNTMEETWNKPKLKFVKWIPIYKLSMENSNWICENNIKKICENNVKKICENNVKKLSLLLSTSNIICVCVLKNCEIIHQWKFLKIKHWTEIFQGFQQAVILCFYLQEENISVFQGKKNKSLFANF